jgi:hypothetical protein
MKLPVQAPAVVRGSFSWPTRRLARGSNEPSVEPAAGAVISCKNGTPDGTPYPCICDNGIATCCKTNAGCSVNPNTGACTCMGKSP